MTKIQTLTITSLFSAAYLFISASAFAEYSQTKNNDKESPPKPVQSQSPSEKKSDNKKSEQDSDNDIHGEGPRDDAAGEHTTGEKPRDTRDTNQAK